LPNNTVFDHPDALQFAEARQRVLRPVLEHLRNSLGIKSAADVGCGVGYFSEFLATLGFSVVGFDGRSDNVLEAASRYPQIPFDRANVEDDSILHRGSFDLVLCVGLLYHLENPLRALRNLARVATHALLIESFIVPGRGTVFHLREEPVLDNQSLTYISLFPSESSIVKFCYRSGFAFLYRFHPLPDHPDFRDSAARRRHRTMLLASRTRLHLPGLQWLPEPRDAYDPWETSLGRIHRYWVYAKSVVARTAAGKAFRSAKRAFARERIER